MEKRFHSIAEVMADLQAKALNKLSEKPQKPEKHGEEVFECQICKDTEFIFYKNEQGYEFARPCECRERKSWKRRFKNALIPEEFTNANFDNYKRVTKIQHDMYQLTIDYLKTFKVETLADGAKTKNRITPAYNFGLIAVYGEQRIKEASANERTKLKNQHNNFGIGKTHLQIALAKRLIKDGFNVLVVSDVTFIEELMQAKRMDDENETYNSLLNNALSADVLLWDDIGKVNWTEPRERMYYTIINERYRKQKPIVFNSNEDRGTLADKIGYAAASRLIGQAADYLLEAEGEDWRLIKHV